MEDKILDKSVASSGKIMNITQISSSIGFIAGLGYAFKKNKSFWGYVGYGLLGSIVFGTVGNIGARVAVI